MIMARNKCDIEIGRRAFEEVKRLFPDVKNGIDRMRMSKNAVYGWKDGATPGALMLARLHYAGADVIYILTGKRTE